MYSKSSCEVEFLEKEFERKIIVLCVRRFELRIEEKGVCYKGSKGLHKEGHAMKNKKPCFLEVGQVGIGLNSSLEVR